jgi:hypothetical protein
MLDNPSCVTQIRNLLANGYAIEFSVEKRRSMPNTVLEVYMRREHTPASPVGASYTLHSVYIARRLIATISVEEA